MQIAEQAIERKGTELYENYASTLQKEEVQQYIGAKVRRFKTEEAFKEYVGEEAIKDKRKTFTDRGKNAAYYNSDTNEIVLKDLKQGNKTFTETYDWYVLQKQKNITLKS